MESGTVPTSSAWSTRLTDIAQQVCDSWDHAASFTHSPNMSAHDRAGAKMEMWCTVLGLDISAVGTHDRAIALARKVVAEGTSSLEGAPR